MGQLTAPRVVLVPQYSVKKTTYPLGAGATAFENGVACLDSARLGAVWPAQGGVGTLTPIGRFLQSVNNSAGGSSVPVGVELLKERWVYYLDSVSGGGAVTIANLFQILYLASDHEVTTVASANSIAGRFWSFSPNGYPNGIGVEFTSL